jgi:integrase
LACTGALGVSFQIVRGNQRERIGCRVGQAGASPFLIRRVDALTDALEHGLSLAPRLGRLDGRIASDGEPAQPAAEAIKGFSRGKRRLDAAMLAAKRAELGESKGDAIPNWTLHDLRRTAATDMARLNFPPHVVDKVLNHASGTIKGVAAVYNRFAYLEERRAGLEAWGRYVENLVKPMSSNVVVFRG